MRKIKWRNVVKSIVLGVASCEFMYLSCMLMFYTLFTGKSCGLSISGLIVYILSLLVIGYITEDFKDQLKKTPKVRRQYK